MHMTRQDLPATKSVTDLLGMLTKATQEGTGNRHIAGRSHPAGKCW